MNTRGDGRASVTPEISHPLALRSQRLLERGKTNQRGLLPSKNSALAHIFVSGGQVPRALKILKGPQCAE